MLLAITTESLEYYINPPDASAKGLMLTELPRFVVDRLGLHGLVVDSKYLKGWSLEQLDKLRNCADQAGCPCLVLRESRGVVTGGDTATQTAAMQRIELVTRAAQRLGCAAVSFRVESAVGQIELDQAARFLRKTMERIERIDVNMLLEHGGGDLARPETLVEMVKKVGGFRVGTMPNFGQSGAGKDCAAILRQTAPYAAAVLATIPPGAGGMASEETGAALSRAKACMESLVTVGFHQILAMDYLGRSDGMQCLEAVKTLILQMDKEG